jgi:hypothetical protein
MEQLRNAGADYVYLPSVEIADTLSEALTATLSGELDSYKARQTVEK